MNLFFDEEKNKPVPNCPSCFGIFIKDWETNCPNNCPAKKLEDEHWEAIDKIVLYCLYREGLPGRRLDIYISNSLITEDSKEINWGKAFSIIGEIHISCYALRSKKMFLHVVAHEVAHITIYEKKFTDEEKAIIQLNLINKEADKNLFDKWVAWKEAGHDENWYREYFYHYQKFLFSPWKKYTYGNFEPLPHEHFAYKESWKCNGECKLLTNKTKNN